jgi:hypothetical protein
MRRSATLASTILVGLGALGGTAAYVMYLPEPRALTFPDGKSFAFTIVDDTDMATLERSKLVYDVLHRYGLRTTKTVWVLSGTEMHHPPNSGASLSDPDYRAFILELQRRGFEIALHGVRGGSSERDDIVAGFEKFKEELGDYPRLHVNHSLNRDNVYWGTSRWSLAPLRWAHRLMSEDRFDGHDPESRYFWGDLLHQHVRYVNQYTFSDINLRNVMRAFPYRLSDKPYVTLWFPTADGDNLDVFLDLLKPENLDRLEREGGVCLVYAHLGAGSFTRDGKVDPRFEARIADVARRNGWFVPASELLDFLASQPDWNPNLTLRERLRLDALFIWTKLKRSFNGRPKARDRAAPPAQIDSDTRPMPSLETSARA